MRKLKDLWASARTVETRDGREVYVANAAEREAIKGGAEVDEFGYIVKNPKKS
jgi:hypothetical protein